MRSSAKHLFRIAALVVPSLIAWIVALTATHRDALTRAVSQALGPVWIVMGAAFVLRLIFVLHQRAREPAKAGASSVLAELDLLTSSGASLAWLSSFAIIGAVWVGWASLAAIGLLGAGVFHSVVLFAFVALRRVNPASGGTFARRFSSSTVTEGDDLIEELVFSVRIPVGFRFFVSSRIGPRWATSRHVLDAPASGGEIALESEVGPAVRGIHHAELVEVWLEDVFGFCRSVTARVAPASLTVLPRPVDVEQPRALLGLGLGERVARPSAPVPTEGSFRLREYQQGDDVRRIHWVRSLSAGQLVVRLPDELPPDQPRVRLVLDTYLPESLTLSCSAPAEMLDRLVATWLGIARALTRAGVRVTLVTAAPRDPREPHIDVVVKRSRVVERAESTALQLGAEAAWQAQLPLSALLTDEATLIVSQRILASPPADPKFRWVMVAPSVDEPEWRVPSGARVPYPMGHSENRWSYRKRAIAALVAERLDHTRAMRAMLTSLVPLPPGSFIAVPTGKAIRLERLS